MNYQQIYPQLIDALMFCLSVIIALLVAVILLIFGDVITNIYHQRQIKQFNLRLSRLEGLVVSDYLTIKNQEHINYD